MLPTAFPPLSAGFDSDEGEGAGGREHALVRTAANRIQDALLSMASASVQDPKNCFFD